MNVMINPPGRRPMTLVFLSLLVFAGVLPAAAPAAPEVKLKWTASGVLEKLGVPSRQPLTLSDAKPDSAKKTPDLKSPSFAELKLGPRESPTTFIVVVDEPDGKPSRLFIDANHNGDLTDDPAPVWSEAKTPGPDGREVALHEGSVTVRIPYPDGAREARLLFSRYDKNSDVPPAFRKFLFYSRDYAWIGDVKLGEKTYAAMLVDESTTGDFRGSAGKSSGV
ncbi:MAG: hypothetical protein QOF48_2859, partial [Verrucomicrobiota bacterium]